jgi:hypothetical protein
LFTVSFSWSDLRIIFLKPGIAKFLIEMI